VRSAEKDCFVVYLGRIGYAQALAMQMQLCKAKREGFAPDVLLLLEHPHTITLGRNANPENLLVSGTELDARNVPLFNADRGGDITYHGPGQLVGYPIIQLEKGERDIHLYMYNLEHSLIQLLALHKIAAGRAEGMTGVWSNGRKIASMGVHISRWITRHGFALNVNTDLSFFRLIIPCGLADKQMTSMQEMLGARLELRDIAEQYAMEFGSIFHRRITTISEDELCREAELCVDVPPTV
jgi:lipoyl(octanoyl) transferase